MASSSSSASSKWIYDVFISFRGEDTRKGFVSHLYAALNHRGICCYKDDETLKRGREISPELLKAIESSRFAIVVFSKNYASSGWCLDELAKILQCRREIGQTVLPIFYHVEPSQVRKHMAFSKAQVEQEEKVQCWRTALTEASNISGWSSYDGRSESVLIEQIASFLLHELKSGSLTNAKELFGIDSRVREIHSLLCTVQDDVRFVGIWGMGGIGKTTVAEVVYDQISGKFDGSCFLANVKDSNLVHLQEKLLFDTFIGESVSIGTPYFGAKMIKERLRFRKVLIVLDDVDELEQLEALGGNCDWFGSGSRILITTRDEHLLIAHNVEKSYKAKGLNRQEAVELFCWKAFRRTHPPHDYVQLSEAVINYANGLPLALKVLGSFLCGRRSNEWESALQKLKTCPHKEIQRILKISYDALDDRQKNLFLDIACFFKGDDKDYLFTVLENDFFPVDFSNLIEKSLITIQDNKVLMHDLLQEMGRDIVFWESPEEPGKRSRLWVREDICHVLTGNLGTEAVKGIVLDLYGLKEVTFNSQAFVKMKNLRLLKISFMHSPGGFDYLSDEEAMFRDDMYGISNELQSLKDCKVHLLGKFKFISDRLKCLYWSGFPLKSLPSRIYHLKNLVELNMCHSSVRQLWTGAKVFEKLRYLKLSFCPNLSKTPDFSGVPNLERLILEGCTNLVEVHPSLGVLKRLILLDMRDCKKLRYLPRVIELDSLKYLYLKGCSKLAKFPEIIRPMPFLQKLYLEGTSITELPLSIRYLTSLVTLDLEGCKHLKSLPRSICMLESLKQLTLSGCSKLEELPEELGSLKSLVGLYVDGTAISKLPSSIVLLKNLSCFSFKGFNNKKSNLRHIPFLSLLFRGKDQIPRTLELSPISRLSELYFLDISGCNISTLPDDFGSLSSLMQLYLSRNSFTTLPSSISRLSKLHFLYLEGCERLQALPQLPSTVDTLVADNCTSLEILPKTSILKYLHAGFSNCTKLLENQEIDDLVATLLQNQLQVPNPPLYFDAVIPGREIPKWFSDQNMGDTVSVQLPESWYDSVTGIVMCVVFESRDGNHPCIAVHEWGPDTLDGCCRLAYFIGAKDDPKFKSNEKHLWLGYLELDAVLNFSVYAWRDHFTDISVWFESNTDSGFVIEKCAARLVHEEDMNDQSVEMIPSTYSSNESDSTRDVSSIIRLGHTIFNLLSWKREWEHDEIKRLVDLVCSGTGNVGLGSGTEDETAFPV